MIESYPAVSPERAQRIALVAGAGAGADNRIFLGAFLELILIIANIGTAVVCSA